MTLQQLTIAMLVFISLIGLFLYYLKFKSDAKEKIKSQGRKDINVCAGKSDSDMYGKDSYEQIIDDYPTCYKGK